MSGRSRILALLGLVIIVLLVGTLGNRLSVREDSDLSCIVEDTMSGGGAGVQRWAERMEFETLPLRAPIWEVGDELPQPGNVLITAGDGSWNPLTDEFARNEWSAVSRWIHSGNALIVMVEDPSEIPTGVWEQFELAEGAEKIIWTNPPNRRAFDELTTATVPTVWDGQMEVNAKGARIAHAPDSMRVAGSKEAVVLAKCDLGKGTIYLLLDGGAWTNFAFDRADNAATLARILKLHVKDGGVLAFDEYRHGRGRVESFVTLFAALPGAKPFLWMSGLLTTFWIWGRNRRFGPAEEFREVERRTAREYIESVASMHERARAAPLAVEAVMNRVKRLLRRKGADIAATAALVARTEELLKRQARPATPTEEIAMVTELIRFRKKLYGTRSDTRAD